MLALLGGGGAAGICLDGRVGAFGGVFTKFLDGGGGTFCGGVFAKLLDKAAFAFFGGVFGEVFAGTFAFNMAAFFDVVSGASRTCKETQDNLSVDVRR